MIWTKQTVLAMRLAYKVHENQKDKLDTPYIFHPMEVASSMPTESAAIAGLLHDLWEDADGWKELDEAAFREKLMAMGFSEKTVSTLVLLTHKKGVPYMEYVAKIINSGDEDAILVKMADLHCNANPARLALISDSDIRERLAKKYEDALKLFNQQLGKKAEAALKRF